MDLSTLITNINGKDFAKAQVIFDDMMNAKVTDALDKEKIKLAGQVFNGDPEDDEDLVDEVEVEGDEDDDDSGDEVEATEGEDPENEGETESSDSEEESGEYESEPEDEVEDEKVQGD